MKSGMGAKLSKNKKIVIADAVAHSHQFAFAVSSGQLSAKDAVDEFEPKHHFTDAEKTVFQMRDDSFIAQRHITGELLAYDRGQEPVHVNKKGLQSHFSSGKPVGMLRA